MQPPPGDRNCCRALRERDCEGRTLPIMIARTKKTAMTAAFCLVCAFIAGCPGQGKAVFFDDVNLESAIRRELGIYFGVITEAAMRELVVLDARNLQLTSLRGIEAAVNLEVLNVSNDTRAPGSIFDLTPISSLNRLRILNLTNNDVSNIVPITFLSSLDQLYLGGNNVFDLSPIVANATNFGSGLGLGASDLVVLEIGPLLGTDGQQGSQIVIRDIQRLIDLGIDVVFVNSGTLQGGSGSEGGTGQ